MFEVIKLPQQLLIEVVRVCMLSQCDTDLGQLVSLQSMFDCFQYETIIYYLETLGCPADKLVLGIPFYGASYTLATNYSSSSSSLPKFGEPVTGAGNPGPYTAAAGTISYMEVFVLSVFVLLSTLLFQQRDTYKCFIIVRVILFCFNLPC